MKTTKSQPRIAASDVATYQFSDHSAAWQFMRDCQSAKIQPGFPSLDSLNRVMVAIKTWMDRETADKLAKGAPCVAYMLAGQDYAE
jgi:hypothetical protein